MLKKIKITDPITGISATFSGVVYDSPKRTFASEVYSESAAKERFAEDIVNAQHLISGNGHYNQTPLWDDEPEVYAWNYALDYRRLKCYAEIEEILNRLIVEIIE